jgi:hypothetical protein
MQTSSSNYLSLFYGVNFLLSHLAKPEFPRTIATKLTEGKQIIVASKEEAMICYKDANYVDCRLAAYPYTLDKLQPQIIDFVMLDLDLNNFKFSQQKLDRALNKILFSLTINPTVIWSGNGYHVLVPVEPLESTLEDMAEFSKFEEPSKKILRWLEKYLSNGKSDSVHNKTVSFGNCMLRIPGSINSKHNNDSNQVRIIREWNNQRFSIKPLLGDFLAYLLDEKDKKSHNNYYKYNTLLSSNIRKKIHSRSTF